jgi:hypothetical protein
MAAPEAIVMERVKAAADTALGPRGLPPVAYDKLLRAAGKDGVAELAVYPEGAQPKRGQRIELVVPVVLQVYLPFNPDPDEHLAVDPLTIVEHAEAFRQTFAPGTPATDDVWFLRLEGIRYPDDPTGNKTRFEALVEGLGTNDVELPR